MLAAQPSIVINQGLTAKQRVLKQLLEALMYEKQLSYQMLEYQGRDNCLFEVRLKNRIITLSGYQGGFDRIHLSPHSIIEAKIAIEDVLAACKMSSEAMNQLEAELHRTYLLTDWNQQHLIQKISRRDLSFYQLEQHLHEGHLYHPCFKARIGFSLADHRLYGPETGHSFQLHWLAIKRELLRYELPFEEQVFWQQEIGHDNWQLLTKRLHLLDADWYDYGLLPIHPWQWLTLREKALKSWLENKSALYLAAAGHSYQATQSVRTVMNITTPDKAFIKLPLNMTTTSSVRTIESHSVCSAPVISTWLNTIVSSDRFFNNEAPFILLQEYAGITINTDDPHLDGQLAAIWRQSIDKHLKAGEQAVPFNALLMKELDDSPFIDSWIHRYGLENWLNQLLTTTILPVWHLLVGHGIAIEAHAQNLILIHSAGWPTRLAARDFHESMEYVNDYLTTPEWKPDFYNRDSHYQTAEPNQFYWMEDVEALRELVVDTLYVYNLAELAYLLNEHYDFAESHFWQLVSTCLKNYYSTQAIPERRIQRLGMNQHQFNTESLVTRKLRYPHQAECHHKVTNPIILK